MTSVIQVMHLSMLWLARDYSARPAAQANHTTGRMAIPHGSLLIM